MKRNTLKILTIVGLPIVYALIMRLLFGATNSYWSDFFAVMSFTFLFLLPVFIGMLTTYLSEPEENKKKRYRFFMPWVPIFLFLIFTFVFQVEGYACIMLMSPIFLIGASVGGFVGAALQKRKTNRMQVSLLMLFPLALAPLESAIDTLPTTYKAYTYIDIEAPAEVIWSHITRVGEIQEDEDRGVLTNFLGFPRPVRAELNYEGVGAYREAIFTKGLKFHETVTEYEPLKKMTFTIKANPYEIPATALDEHVVIGGDYFDVLNGTYELEPLANGTYRLHLYSHFEMNTTFNFYAGLWAKWIMKDIQNNILQIEKKRAEAI